MIVVQYGMLRCVQEVEADVVRQSLDDPVDTKKVTIIKLLWSFSRDDCRAAWDSFEGSEGRGRSGDRLSCAMTVFM